MPTFEQLASLPENYSVTTAFATGATPATATLDRATVRYFNPGGATGFQIFGVFSLNAAQTQFTGGNIIQIDLLESSGSLSGRISGLNGFPVLTFLNLLATNPQALVAAIFSGDDIIISPQHGVPTKLEGFAGNDLLRAARTFGDAADILDGGSGDDELFGGGGNDRLFGGTDNDDLYGEAGNDSLRGDLGQDRMFGGTGNDVYYVDNVLDKTFEYFNEGNDSVQATVSWTLSDQIEALTLLEPALNGTGSDGGNFIVGNTRANRLDGRGGNDQIEGRLGNDILTGGLGADSFKFNTTLNGVSNKDTITDFSHTDDRILLDDAVFVGIGPVGQLSAAAFYVAGAPGAGSINHRIIYDSTIGVLFFDPDGGSPGVSQASVAFAVLTGAPKNVAFDDFVIV